MSRQPEQQLMTCPFCRHFGSHDFATLEKHVQHHHAEQQNQSNGAPQSGPSASEMSDFELAQLLAFEEAGLPAELALSDRSNVPARHHDAEGAPQNGQKTPSPPNSGDSWVQCACGERVHFLELDAHSDMHAQENISIEEPEVPVKDVELSLLKTSVPPPVEFSNCFNATIPRSLRNYDQIHPSRTPPSNEKRHVPSLKEIFLGTPASPKRKSSYSAVSSKIGKTRRLGVSSPGLSNLSLHS